MDKNKKILWRFPWGYRESFIIAIGLMFTGFILDLATGNQPIAPPAFPLNAIILVLFIVYKIITFKAVDSPLMDWLTSIQAAIAATGAYTLLVLFMGFIPQGTEIPLLSSIGLTHVKTSWPYLIITVFMLTVLGYTTIKRFLKKITWKNAAFSLNHAGLFIIISGASLGSGDFYRLRMPVFEGKTSNYAYLGKKPVEMPFQIYLHDFKLYQYNPNFVLVNNKTKQVIKTKNEHDNEIKEEKIVNLGEWKIKILKHLPYSGKKDSIFIKSNDFGAVHAALVQVTCNKGERNTGWITCGNFSHRTKMLTINDTLSIAMTSPKPKKYLSVIDIIQDSQMEKNITIEVNKPFRFNGWKIYQYNYSQKHGRWSDMSVLELVRDPWQPVVYTGIFMVLAGALYLLLSGLRKINE